MNAAVFTWGVFRAHGAVRGVSAAQIDVGGATADGLMNIETIKAFTAERRFEQHYDDLLGRTERKWRVFLARRLENGLAVALVFGLAVGAVHVLAGLQVSLGAMTLGSFVLVNTYALQLVRPLEAIGFAVRDIGQGLGYLDALATTLAQRPEITHQALEDTAAPPDSADEAPARLQFENVDFGYGDRHALSDISFTVEAGSLVGVVGPSGAGKSSLLRLILGFHVPDEGRILLDDTPIADLPLPQLRRQIALVAQDTILFNDTIGANIRLAGEDADEAEVEAAARTARLSAFLARLPDGLDTRVGERGLKLSGGEKQRVSIARAALKKARLVIFDEATAALDPETEAAVWAAMRGLARQTTALVVSHRLSTVADADQILVLDQGRIVEAGVHADLVAANGLYARLWRAQSRGAVKATSDVLDANA